MPNISNKDISGFSQNETSNVAILRGVNYLFIIAIDAYKHCPKLYNAVKDAKEVASVLTNKFQFQEENVRCLFDTAATKKNIYQEFRSYAQKITNKDNLIIYFSGHGEYDEFLKDGYWIPFEAEKDGIDQYLANSEIRSFLSAIKTHHTFIMIDSCFSGSLFAKGASRNAALAKERDPSRWGLTSGRNEIVTDGHPGENSPFAQSIIYYLDKTDSPVGVAELCDKVLEVVTSNANQTPRGEPLKVEGHKGGQFVFHLKKNEDQDWHDAKKADSIASYETFLKIHPIGKFSEEANRRLLGLKEEHDWVEAKAINNLEAFYNFTQRYPNSKHERQARALIHSIEEDKSWQIAQNAETVSKYMDYLQAYKNGRYANEAHKRINEILSKHKTVLPQHPPVDQNKIKPVIDRLVSSIVDKIYDFSLVSSKFIWDNGRNILLLTGCLLTLWLVTENRSYIMEMLTEYKKSENPSYDGKAGSKTEGNPTRTTPLEQKGEVEISDPLPLPETSISIEAKSFGEILWTTGNLDINVEGSWRHPNFYGAPYGRLYTWEAAKKACSSLGLGWRLPTDAEWRSLARSFDRVDLDAAGGGVIAYTHLIAGGRSGFNARLAGYRDITGHFESAGESGMYWTSSSKNSSVAWRYSFTSRGKLVRKDSDKKFALSCRCVK